MAVRVLIVSADDSFIDDTRATLPGDFDVSSAPDARVALDLMRRARPSVAVLDLQSGSAGGFALARDMDADVRLRSVPIVMLLEREQDTWLAEQAGARLIRIKPIESATLADEIAKLAG